MNNFDPQFVEWFRSASPYIHMHRGSTVVVYFGGEALGTDEFPHLIHDLALLSSLGMKLIVVHGARPQIEDRLKINDIATNYSQGLRVTDLDSLSCVKEAVGATRVEIEALFSTGIVNSPMAGAQIQVASGNFVTAKPLGVREGIDFCHTGEVRRIDAEAITRRLDCGEIVLISPVGYSPTGEVFNLSSFDVASSVAVALKADKLILLTEGEKCLNAAGNKLQQMTQKEVEACLENDNQVSELLCALAASQHGVERVHLIDRAISGGLLLELFTRDGVGTLLSAISYDELHQATVDDIGGILELLSPLEKAGALAKRSREKLEIEIDHFTVMKRDHAIIACGALYPYQDENLAELACIAVDDEYRDSGRGEILLKILEKQAREMNIAQLFVLTTHTAHWFLEHGFSEGEISNLPKERQSLYNFQRNSKVFFKAV